MKPSPRDRPDALGVNADRPLQTILTPSQRAILLDRLAEHWETPRDEIEAAASGEHGSAGAADLNYRVGLLVGIYRTLHVLYDGELADCWMTLPNSNVPFAGGTPWSHIRAHGQEALVEVRLLLNDYARPFPRTEGAGGEENSP